MHPFMFSGADVISVGCLCLWLLGRSIVLAAPLQVGAHLSSWPRAGPGGRLAVPGGMQEGAADLRHARVVRARRGRRRGLLLLRSVQR